MAGEASELKSAASQVELTEMKDSLLQNFSKAQKAYIIKNLYPELSRAQVHFISEAKRHNQFDELSPVEAASPEKSLMQRKESSTFGGFKMGAQAPNAAQPSNMQLNNSFAKTASPNQNI